LPTAARDALAQAGPAHARLFAEARHELDGRLLVSARPALSNPD